MTKSCNQQKRADQRAQRKRSRSGKHPTPRKPLTRAMTEEEFQQVINPMVAKVAGKTGLEDGKIKVTIQAMAEMGVVGINDRDEILPLNRLK
ncbi:MAG: hypothetical protein H7833_03030 [Magnetococcus sp. DMHC-1]|nr:hypothetical protein [Magnetococcales bacterium]